MLIYLPGKKYLFKKLNDDEWLFHKTMYDLVSAGHFHHHRYSANGRATIEFRVSSLSSATSSTFYTGPGTGF